MYIERVNLSDLFDVDDPADAFVITDDFMRLAASAVRLVFQFHN